MKYIKSYDGLRGISILFVLAAHLGIAQLLPQDLDIRECFSSLVTGETGVTIFFVLSGMLITSILLKELKDTNRISLRGFYIRRFLRLLPALVIFYLILAILMQWHLIKASRESFAFSCFYLYNFVPPGIYVAELAHTWSLAVEEQFYFTWPLILCFFSSKKAMYAGFILLILCILARTFYGYIYITYNGERSPITSVYRTGRWFIPAVAPIMIGSITAVAISRYAARAKEFFLNYKWCLFLALVLFVLPFPLPPLWDYKTIFQGLATALLLGTLLFNQQILLSRILSFGPLVYIGKISYGLYVYQGLFLRNGPGGHLLINRFPLNIGLTLALAVLSYHFVEKPILRSKERFREPHVQPKPIGEPA